MPKGYSDEVIARLKFQLNVGRMLPDQSACDVRLAGILPTKIPAPKSRDSQNELHKMKR
jgi:hypothetical protein